MTIITLIFRDIFEMFCVGGIYAYLSKIGSPDYPEATRTAQAFVKAAPERLVWGSDWPHPSEQNRTLPDDALLFDLLAVWAPDESTRKRILVDNPENLYGFAKAA
jgi:predicted TIM-barrel fold metal-dependent hydrolase